MKKAPDNACGNCRMCCKLLAVNEIEKPAGQWCSHACAGKGCAIYAERPQPCIDYECMWLHFEKTGPAMPAAFRPDRCGIVLDNNEDGTAVVMRADVNKARVLHDSLLRRFVEERICKPNGFNLVLAAGNGMRKLIHFTKTPAPTHRDVMRQHAAPITLSADQIIEIIEKKRKAQLP